MNTTEYEPECRVARIDFFCGRAASFTRCTAFLSFALGVLGVLTFSAIVVTIVSKPESLANTAMHTGSLIAVLFAALPRLYRSRIDTERLAEEYKAKCTEVGGDYEFS